MSYRVPYSQQHMTLSGFVSATNLVVQVGLSNGIDPVEIILAHTDLQTNGPFSVSWTAPVSTLNYIQITLGSLNYFAPFQSEGTVTTTAHGSYAMAILFSM